MKQINFTTIDSVLNRVTDHPLLQNVSLEKAIRYAADLIGIVNNKNLYSYNESVVKINNHAGPLPCGIIRVDIVKDLKTGICMPKATNSFMYVDDDKYQTFDFKIVKDVIYTSFKNGEVLVSYYGMELDDEGFPMIPDTPEFQLALEAYIKYKEFTILSDCNRISMNTLQQAQLDYGWAVGRLTESLIIPDVNEMESITNSWNQQINRNKHFSNGFKQLGAKENWRIH